MGWLQSKGRRQPFEPATFAQTLVIVRGILLTYPHLSDFELSELSKEHHVTLRFHYDNQQIHKAIDALTDPARQKENRSNKRSARWRSEAPAHRRHSGDSSPRRFEPR